MKTNQVGKNADFLLSQINIHIARLEQKIAQYYNPQFSVTRKEINEVRQNLKNEIAKLAQEVRR